MRIVQTIEVLDPAGRSLWGASKGIEVAPTDDWQETALRCLEATRRVNLDVMDEIEEQAKRDVREAPGAQAKAG